MCDDEQTQMPDGRELQRIHHITLSVTGWGIGGKNAETTEGKGCADMGNQQQNGVGGA